MRTLFLTLRCTWGVLLLTPLALLACSQNSSLVVSNVEPDTLELAGYSLSTPTTTFQLHNTSRSALSYHVTASDTWLTIFLNARGELPAEQRTTVHVQADCPERPVERQGTLTVHSDDPRHTPVSLTLRLQCQADNEWRVSPSALHYPGFTDPAQSAETALSLHNFTLHDTSLVLSSSASWLTLPVTLELPAGTSKTIMVQAEPCTGMDETEAHLVVQTPEKTVEVPITRRCTLRTTGPDLWLERFYINQAVPAADTAQPASARVPLIADRSGLVRAFLGSSAAWAEPVTVRFHYRTTAGLQGFVDLSGPEGVPQDPQEGELLDTFNTLLNGHLLQPGLQVYLEIDPEGHVGDPDLSNNRYPPAGYMTLDVQQAPRLSITLVPVRHKGVTPVVDENTRELYLERVRQMFPVANIDIQVRTPYTFNGDLSTTNGWGRLLSELTNLRSADGSLRHYYGIVDPGYRQGIAGIAWIGLPIAAGWNRMPSGSAIAAHELGHNWGRGHAPCKVTGEPHYPYPEAEIGIWGYDATRDILYRPSSKDIMSYCGPQWASDYTYRGILEFRREQQDRLSIQSVTEGSALFVSGLVHHEEVLLHPAFLMHGVVTRAEAGPYTLVGTDANEQVLFRVSFNTYVTSLHHEAMAGFNLTVPLTDQQARTLTSLKVEYADRLVTERHITLSVQNARSTRLQRLRQGEVGIHWDTTTYRSVIVRELHSGTILALDDTGYVTVQSEDALELLLSDGVQTLREVVYP